MDQNLESRLTTLKSALVALTKDLWPEIMEEIRHEDELDRLELHAEDDDCQLRPELCKTTREAFVNGVNEYIKPVSWLIAAGMVSDVELAAKTGKLAKLEAEGFFRSIARLVELCAHGEACGSRPVPGQESSFIFAALLRKQSEGLSHGAIRAVEYLLFAE